MMRRVLTAVALALALAAGAGAAEKMELRNTGRKWTLTVDGRPYRVRGVTWGMTDLKTDADYDARMRELRDMGVNTIRTWGVGPDTGRLLDAAGRHGIGVMLGLWLRHGRAGAEGDDSFNWVSDTEGKKRQAAAVLEAVRRYHRHPALLFWGVGNEVILNIATDREKHAYAEFLGGLLKEIRRIDSVHLITSAGAWTLAWPYWKEHCPELDIYGVNSYGPGAAGVPDEERRLGVNKPYILTEFGPRGEWDAPRDRNGLRLEPQDDEKHRDIVQGWREWIQPKEECLGGFFFNFAADREPTHPGLWLSAIVGDRKRPGYWAVREALTGEKPANAAPEIREMRFPKDTARQGGWVRVQLAASDPENDPLDIRFAWNQRLDGASRGERDRVRFLESRGDLRKGFEIRLPEKTGLLKIYALVSDGRSLTSRYASFVATAGEPGAEAAPGRAAETWPFYVYRDADAKNHYVPSGLMAADAGKLRIDHRCAENPHGGETCVRVTSAGGNGWFGMAYQDPANDWGERPGGHDLTGAKRLVVWARGRDGGEKVKFGVGMIAREKRFFDTVKKEIPEVVLGKEWRRYEIDLTDCDLRRVKTGFTWFSAAPAGEVTFYLDDIAYEK